MTDRPDIKSDIEAYLLEACVDKPVFVVESFFFRPDGVAMEVEEGNRQTFETLPDAVRAFEKERVDRLEWAILIAEIPYEHRIRLASKDVDGSFDRAEDFIKDGELWHWKSAEGERQARNVPTEWEFAMQENMRVAADAVNSYIRSEDARAFSHDASMNPEGHSEAHLQRNTEAARLAMVQALAVLRDNQMQQVIDANQRRDRDGSAFPVIKVADVRKEWRQIEANERARKADLTIPPEITGVERGQKQTAAELWKSPDARREYARQEGAKDSRSAALDRMLEDQKNGSPVNANNLNHLYTDEVQKIRDGKQAALDKILKDHEQEKELARQISSGLEI